MKNIRNQFGFTIAELLVTVVIIAILAVGIFSVKQKAEKYSEIDMVKNQLVIIDTALEQYFDFHGEFYDMADGYSADCGSDIEELYYRLSLVPQAKKAIDKLDASLLVDDDDDGILEIIDPWENNIQYTITDINDPNILLNFPLVWSSGPDGGKLDESADDDITNR